MQSLRKPTAKSGELPGEGRAGAERLRGRQEAGWIKERRIKLCISALEKSQLLERLHPEASPECTLESEARLMAQSTSSLFPGHPLPRASHPVPQATTLQAGGSERWQL